MGAGHEVAPKPRGRGADAVILTGESADGYLWRLCSQHWRAVYRMTMGSLQQALHWHATPLHMTW